MLVVQTRMGPAAGQVLRLNSQEDADTMPSQYKGFTSSGPSYHVRESLANDTCLTDCYFHDIAIYLVDILPMPT